jgi:hypothetical protein
MAIKFDISNKKTSFPVSFDDGFAKGTFKVTMEDKGDRATIVDLADIDMGEYKQTFIEAFNDDNWLDAMKESVFGSKGVELGLSIMNARADFLQLTGRAKR